MTPRFARHAVRVAASVTVTVAGLLAVAGTASAAGIPGGEQSARARVATGHDRGDWCGGEVHVTGRDDARRAWVVDQVQWAAEHGLPQQDRVLPSR